MSPGTQAYLKPRGDRGLWFSHLGPRTGEKLQWDGEQGDSVEPGESLYIKIPGHFHSS